MQVCHMALGLSLPEENGTSSRFADILEDEQRMSSIFEKFVRNFYWHELSELWVSSEVIGWVAEGLTPEQSGYLPRMITDVTLRSLNRDRTIVIDTKFYPQILVSRFCGQAKVLSENLHQLQLHAKYGA
jgi:5-methylcytosine-specific restriction enzyme subunit McrC